MKTLEIVINTLIEKDIKNRIIYTGECDRCGEFFYSYATNWPSYCGRGCRFPNRHINCSGYIGFYVDGKQKVYHRVLMEKHLGITLGPDQDVHHINGVKLDNRLENLEVLTKSEHTKRHHDNDNL